jgi:hypothetical protein
MLLNVQPGNRNKYDFIKYQTKYWEYELDVFSRKKCYLIKINWKIQPISKKIIDWLIHQSSNQYDLDNYNIDLSVFGIENWFLKASTYEILLQKTLHILAEILQQDLHCIVSMKNTINREQKSNVAKVESICENN